MLKLNNHAAIDGIMHSLLDIHIDLPQFSPDEVAFFPRNASSLSLTYICKVSYNLNIVPKIMSKGLVVCLLDFV